MAAREPDVGFLALERVPDVAMLAMEKCKSLGIKNVRFIIGDIMKLWDTFADHSLDRIYLNFPTPGQRSGTASAALHTANFSTATGAY